uniref:transmembrane protease serine 12-like n=1 Tax=Pristiophorus japonicus TaxID=55135 RepID=UPI00398F3FF3
MELTTAVLLLACVSWIPRPGAARTTDCGSRPLMANPIPLRVLGGQDTLPGAWPWQVSVQLKQHGTRTHICGGIIIDTRWVLSAAHCFSEKLSPSSLWVVVTGLHDRSEFSAHTRMMVVRKVIVHHQFEARSMINDIALLHLRSAMEYSDYVQPICVPVNGTVLADIHLCFITGWGPSSDILQEAEVDLIPTNICNQRSWYDGMITEKMQCAGYENGSADGCQGDSGGPLQCFNYQDQKFYLLGVSSFGVHCGLPRKVGVFTRPLQYEGWIRRMREANGAETTHGGHAAPSLLRCLLLLLSMVVARH